MTTLRRAKDNGHFFIRVGPSEGTKQIKDEGINWLLKQPGYQLSPGEKVLLHRGDYRYLDDKGYLYTEGISYDKHEASTPSSLDDEIEKEGPTLLLQLDRKHSSSEDIGFPWTLILKLDELEEQAQRELTLKAAVAITIGLSATPQRTLDLRWLQYARHWPKVSPQLTPYNIYYLNSQNNLFPLANSAPTQGLENGWRGNIFLRIDSPQLPDTWRRSRIDEQISIDTCKEFYWIAQLGQEPEEWPGRTEPIGSVYKGWQLWHLQTQTITDDNTWETVRKWLSYRLIRLVYLTWRLRFLSPLRTTTGGRDYIYSSDQHLLLRCDPPDQQSANTSAHTTLALTTVQNSYPRKQTSIPLQSSVLQQSQSNYLYTPPLTNGQEYRIRLQDEASGPANSIQVRPLARTQPLWLRGLSCTLIASSTQYTFSAFSKQPEEKQSFHLRVPKDFSLEDFSELTWKLEPAGVPCSLTWDYCTLQEEIFHDPPMNALSEDTLNSWWQMKIWPTIANSSWARIIIDASSFGHIEMTLHLKPEPLADNQWWRDEQLLAIFIWLSNTGERDTARHKHPVLPALRDMLFQLGESHDLPSTLANALFRLASRRHMPDWMQVRLQRAVSDIQYKKLFEQTNKQEI